MIAKWLGGLLVSMLLVPSSAADVLDRQVHSINPNMTVGDAVDDIGRQIGAQVVVAWDSLNMNRDSKLFDAYFADCTARAALRQIFGFAAEISPTGNLIHVSERSRMPLSTRMYSIGELSRSLSPLFPAAGADQIQNLVSAMIRPDDWIDNGGTCELRRYGEHLAVTQTPQGHEDIETFLELLRSHVVQKQPQGVDLGPLSEYAVLRRPIAQLRLIKAPLEDVLDLLQKVTRSNMVIHWRALKGVGLLRQERVSVDLSGMTFGEALDELRANLFGRIEYSFEDGVIVIGTPETMAQRVIFRVYELQPVVQLALSYSSKWRPGPVPATGARTHGQDVFDGLVRMIETDVSTDSWKDNGGSTGACRQVGGYFIVAQTRAAHRHIAWLLNEMQAATQPGVPQTAHPQSRPDPLAVNIAALDLASTPLEEVIDRLARQAHAQIIVDWQSIEEAGVPRNSPVDLRLTDVPLGTALSVALEVAGRAHKLAFRADDKGVIRISTSERLAPEPLTRIYNIRDLIDGYVSHRRSPAPQRPPSYQDAVDQITRIIEETVNSDSWRDNGGSIGSLHEFAGLLIITNTPESQQKVKAFLDKLRAQMGVVPGEMRQP